MTQRSDVEVVEEGIRTKHLSCHGVGPSIQGNALDAEVDMVVCPNHVGVSVKALVGGVQVQAVVTEAPLRRHPVSLMLIVEHGEETF